MVRDDNDDDDERSFLHCGTKHKKIPGTLKTDSCVFIFCIIYLTEFLKIETNLNL